MAWWVVENDIGWWLRVLALGLDEPGLEVDDVLAQRIVLCLDSLVVILQIVQIPDLLLELLDISFLALTKGTLLAGYVSLRSGVDDMRIDKAERPIQKV